MKQRELKALEFKSIEHLLKCPIDGEPMYITDETTLKCQRNHTFDIAKQGYINLLNRPSDAQYTTQLFESRSIIIQSGLYNIVHQHLADMISKVPHMTLLDAGCGEGTHLQKITEQLTIQNAIGIDISKDGIVLAAKQYKKPLWLVGDLAQLPFKDQSIDVILNFLSPANYAEFNRVITEKGIVIKVLPGARYLQELRTLSNQKSYSNHDVVQLFGKHFDIVDTVTLQYTVDLDAEQLEHLLQMTPLGWNIDDTMKETFISNTKSITIHLELIVGQRS